MPELVLHLFLLLSCDQSHGKEILRWEFTVSGKLTLDSWLQISEFTPFNTMYLSFEKKTSLFLGSWVCLGV